MKCSDYRPISLLEKLYKLLSKLLLEKVVPSMTNLCRPHQFGFSKGRAMSLCSASTGALIFFDIQSAFDCVIIFELKFEGSVYYI